MYGAIGKGWLSSPNEVGKASKLLGTPVLSAIAAFKMSNDVSTSGRTGPVTHTGSAWGTRVQTPGAHAHVK